MLKTVVLLNSFVIFVVVDELEVQKNSIYLK